MAHQGHYHVYVIELAKQVLDEPRFRRANPSYQPGKPCVYVGMTGVDPDVRFDKHKAGIQANRYVQRFGLLRSEQRTSVSTGNVDEGDDCDLAAKVLQREAGTVLIR